MAQQSYRVKVDRSGYTVQMLVLRSRPKSDQQIDQYQQTRSGVVVGRQKQFDSVPWRAPRDNPSKVDVVVIVEKVVLVQQSSVRYLDFLVDIVIEDQIRGNHNLHHVRDLDRM